MQTRERKGKALITSAVPSTWASLISLTLHRVTSPHTPQESSCRLPWGASLATAERGLPRSTGHRDVSPLTLERRPSPIRLERGTAAKATVPPGT